MPDISSDGSDEIDFSWGVKGGRGGKKKEVQFYKSFTFDHVEYSLYDSVYLFKEGESKPYIGKLLKIWELPNKERKVKILWFFYPSEISNYLKDESVLENELFLATGVGKGLTNVNLLESIAGKCNVVCISKDERNRQPSVEELHKAHHVFYRTFNVENHSISEKLDDQIAMTEVHLLLNKDSPELSDPPLINSGNDTVDLDKLLTSINDTIVKDAMECDASDDYLALKDNREDICSEGKLIGKVSGDDRGSKGTGDNLDLSSSSRKITSSLPESKQKDVSKILLDENATNNVLELVDSQKNSLEDLTLPITGTENKSSTSVKGGKNKPTSGKPDNRPLKKLKLGGNSVLPCDTNGETCSPKPAIVGSESKEKSRLLKEVGGLSNGVAKKVKTDGLTEDKSKKVKNDGLTEDKSKDNAASKASQLANGDGGTDDKRNVKKLFGSRNGVSKKLKSNSVVEDNKSNDKLHKVAIKEDPKNMKIEVSQHVKEVVQRPPDRSKWFTATPWEDRLKEAFDQGRLVLLLNLYPAYTSSEIEDIIWRGFQESCNAKVVQRTASSNRVSGQAFVIFKTREIAEKVLRKLETDCLMLPNGWPLVGTRGVVNFPGKQSSFPGHLVIDKLRHQLQKESREAVSTSHSSQPNTLEFEMAIEWRLLQDRSDLSWKMLYKRQGDEIKKTKANMKSICAS